MEASSATASRFDAARGSAGAWVMTIAHRRGVDRVRSEQAATRREQSMAFRPVHGEDAAELVESALDQQRVRRCGLIRMRDCMGVPW
jgi:RNA polymerase sigma-70 factor (ECF subfamily)